MTNQAVQNREQLQVIRRRMVQGEISYAEAKELAAPVIADINAKAKEIAKKYGKRPQLVSFAAIMR